MIKHPKIYSDLMALYHSYWSQHQRMPKSFRFTTGERILNQLDSCMQAVIEANLVDKKSAEQCQYAVDLLRQVRSTLIVLRGFLHNGWQLKIISHKSLAQLQLKLDSIEKQVAKWQQWFMQKQPV